MLVKWALQQFGEFGMRLIVLVGSPSVQKHQDAKSQECEFPSSESVRCNINSHQGSIKGGGEVSPPKCSASPTFCNN